MISLKLLPLVKRNFCGELEPAGGRAALTVDVGRLRVCLGFWRFDLPGVPTFTFIRRCFSPEDVGGMVRVWRFMAGARWKRGGA